MVSIINRAASILVMFKHNLKVIEIIIFELDLEKIEVEIRDIWEDSNLSNPKIIARLDFNGQ